VSTVKIESENWQNSENTLRISTESMSLLTKEELEVRLEQIQQDKLLITMEEKLHEFEAQCNVMLYHLNHHCKC